MNIVEKIKQEKAFYKESGGLKGYLKNREVKLNMLGFVASLLAMFVLGAIIF